MECKFRPLDYISPFVTKVPDRELCIGSKTLYCQFNVIRNHQAVYKTEQADCKVHKGEITRIVLTVLKKKKKKNEENR